MRRTLRIIKMSLIWLAVVHLIDPAAAQTIPSTVAVVIDTSGSMVEEASYVIRAVQRFIDDIDVGATVVLIRFDVFSEIIETQKIETQADRDALKNHLRSLSFRGPKTNFDEALKGAQAGLFSVGVYANANILIFSDGITDPSTAKPKIDLMKLAQRVFPQSGMFAIFLINVSTGIKGVKHDVNQNVVTVTTSPDGVQQALSYIRERASAQKSAPEPTSVEPESPHAPPADPVASAPLRKSPMSVQPAPVLALFLLLALGLIAWVIWKRLRPVKYREVQIEVVGREETHQTLIARDRDPITLGPGACAYPVESNSTAVLVLANKRFYVGPAAADKDRVSIQDGSPLTEWTPIASGDVLVLDDLLRCRIEW